MGLACEPPGWQLPSGDACKRCGREDGLGFLLPDHMWDGAVPNEFHQELLCLLCFDELATERGVDWRAYPVQFCAVSGLSQRRRWAITR
jgi:hypothetical protein